MGMQGQHGPIQAQHVPIEPQGAANGNLLGQAAVGVAAQNQGALNGAAASNGDQSYRNLLQYVQYDQLMHMP